MKNKYQEALDTIRTYYDTWTGASIGFMYGKEINLLQQLIDKETPMLVTDIHVDEFYCPKCHSEITHDINNYGARPRYCEDCGQRLDWGHYE